MAELKHEHGRWKHRWCATQFKSLSHPPRKGVNLTSVLKVCIIGHEQP